MREMLTDRQFKLAFNSGFIRNHLEVRLIPQAQISDYNACIKTFPHLDFGLGLVVRISDKIGIKVSEDYAKAIGTDFETLWAIWLESDPTKIQIETMSAVLSSFFIETSTTEEEHILICQYDGISPGAGAIFHPAVQEKILGMEEFRDGFHILFSSTNESLIVPIRYSAQGLQEMLREINSKPDIVPADEVASNYIYDCIKPCYLEKVVIE